MPTLKNKPTDEKFEQIYKELYNKLFSFLLKKTKDIHLIEDTIQSVFLASLQFADYESNIHRLTSWFHSAVTNLNLNNYRRKTLEISYLKNLFSTTSATIDDHMLEDLIKKETLNNISKAVNTLTQIEQKIIKSAYLEETLNDSAKKLDMKENTYKKKKKEAIQKLRYRTSK